MAQSQQPRGEGEAEFVGQIVTDPRNVPDVMRLYGYLGASSEENHERHYLDADLRHYVEVPRSAILHRMAVPTEQDPNGAVVLWVRRDAALIYKSAPAAQALANYFAGAIAGAAAAGPVPNLAGAPHTVGACPTFNPIVCTTVCATRVACTLLCPTDPLFCDPFRNAPLSIACVGAAAMAAARPFLASGVPNVACTPACGLTAQANCTNACGTVACRTDVVSVCAACLTQQGLTPCAPCTQAPACQPTPVCLTVHALTLCAAGGPYCAPDCPTHPDVCGFAQAAPVAAAGAMAPVMPILGYYATIPCTYHNTPCCGGGISPAIWCTVAGLCFTGIICR